MSLASSRAAILSVSVSYNTLHTHSTLPLTMPQLRLQGNTPDEPGLTPAMRRATSHLRQLPALSKEPGNIHNAAEAHVHLEKTELIIPSGQSISLGLLSTVLHHVTNYRGIPKPVNNAIQSIAFLIEDLEKGVIWDSIQDSVTSQLTDLGNKLKTFLADTSQQIKKVVTNNIRAVACLVDENYTNQLAVNILDILQTKISEKLADTAITPHSVGNMNSLSTSQITNVTEDTIANKVNNVVANITTNLTALN